MSDSLYLSDLLSDVCHIRYLYMSFMCVPKSFLAIIPTAMPSAPQSPLTGLTAVMPQTGQAETQPQQYQLYDQSQLQFAQSKSYTGFEAVL